jgi:hypothetical protein
LAVALRAKSMSPARIFWAISGSCPSAALGNWRMANVPLLISVSFCENVSAKKP